MQTLAEFAGVDEKIRPKVMKKLKGIIKTGNPAEISRGKKLILRLEKK
jgi:hypothetical protein